MIEGPGHVPLHEVGNMIIFGFSRHATYLMGGDLLFDGGMVLTY